MKSRRIIKDIEEEILPEFSQELKKLEGKTIFITGGNGFLPSYLVDTFTTFNQTSNNPIKLIIMNKNPISDDSRLSHLSQDKNVQIIVHDVGKPFIVSNKPDIIIHAASRANPKSFLADPIDTINTNINGLNTLLNYAKENPIEQFLFFSSGENYGNPLPDFIPTPESYPGNIDPLSKYACYIEAKRFGETLAMAYHRQHNVPIKLLRILLAYGPGIRDDGKVVSDFFNAAIQEEQIVFRDRGEAKRSFMYASDATRAILRVLFSGESGEAYNIADDTNNISISELASLIAKTLDPNIQVKPNFEAPKKEIYGIDTRNLDITKLRTLGFQPKVPLSDGLHRLKQHYIETGKIKET